MMGGNEQTPALPEDMIETLARAFAEEEAELTGTETFQVEARHRETATTVLTSALAGRTVLEPPAKARVVHLLPDDVVVIGNAHEASRAHKAMAEIKALWPERRVVCFADDIDVEVLRDGSLLASESSGDGSDA